MCLTGYGICTQMYPSTVSVSKSILHLNVIIIYQIKEVKALASSSPWKPWRWALSSGCNGVILPLANAPAPWSSVHSFHFVQTRQRPEHPLAQPLQNSGSPPPSPPPLLLLLFLHPALSDFQSISIAEANYPLPPPPCGDLLCSAVEEVTLSMAVVQSNLKLRST